MDTTALLLLGFTATSVVFTAAVIRSRRKHRTSHLSRLGKAVPRILTPMTGHDEGIVTPKRTKKPHLELD